MKLNDQKSVFNARLKGFKVPSKKVWNLKYIAGNPKIFSKVISADRNPMSRGEALDAASTIEMNGGGWRVWIENDKSGVRIYESKAEMEYKKQIEKCEPHFEDSVLSSSTEICGRHLFLYAKGAYEKSNDSLLSDLRRIVSHELMQPIECIMEDDIYRVCINTTLEHVFSTMSDSDCRIKVRNLLIDIGKKQLGVTQQRSPQVAIVVECLSILALTQVRSDDGSILINLGNPDPKVLPLASFNYS